MEKVSFLTKIREEGHSFYNAVSRTSETFYLVLFTLYVTIYFMLKFGWTTDVEQIEGIIRYTLLGIVMWGSAVYLFFVIAEWKKLWEKNIALLIIGTLILCATYLFSKRMSTNSYGVVMDIFFCMMACGKDYKKILKCVLGVSIVMLVIAGLGMPIGYTLDLEKPENVHPGHSLGINYPNTWGYLAFLGMISLWYLYLRFKPLLSFFFFWSVSTFMYFYICCRTIGLIGFAFPVLALIVDILEKRAIKKADEGGEGEKKRLNVLEWIMVAIPMISFAFMMFMSMQYEFIHKHFYYNWFRNLAMRFVQGGLYFRTYGLPLFGNPYRSNQYTYVNVNGVFEKVGILDSSFAAYIIMRGMVWIMYTLLWLCLAHYKALKKRDYAIILLESIILIFAMMERPGLELWYNSILLYPLAKVVGKTRVEMNDASTGLTVSDDVIASPQDNGIINDKTPSQKNISIIEEVGFETVDNNEKLSASNSGNAVEAEISSEQIDSE